VPAANTNVSVTRGSFVTVVDACDVHSVVHVIYSMKQHRVYLGEWEETRVTVVPIEFF